jgi:mutator protein MutT
LKIVVTAAVVERGGEFLVTRRMHGVHLAGLWEFPGGKCEPGEAHEACLRREMVEELAVDVRVRDLVLHVEHAYSGKTVALYFYGCDLIGEPRPLLGQEMRWVPRQQLRSLEFPAADGELLKLLTG